MKRSARNLDKTFMRHAVEIALDSERQGNLPVGAVVTLDREIIAEGTSRVLKPLYHPGRHAEMVALGEVEETLWHRAAEMTCYTTLEPCVMCAGALLLHGVGRVVFGARDRLGGAGCILDSLPPYYDEGGVYEWVGPILPEICDPLYRRADDVFAALPVGRRQWSTTAVEVERDSADEYLGTLESWARPDEDEVGLRDARRAATRFAETVDADTLEAVLPYALAIFERTGYLKDYRSLKKYARRAGRPEFLEEASGAVRRHLPDVWIKTALDRGDLDAAIECWFEHEENRRIRLCADRLVAACGEDQVEVIMSCRLSQIEYRIGRGNRRHYRRACTILRRLRDELRGAGAADYWPVIIEDLIARYPSRPALLDELSRAGFISDASGEPS